MPLSWVCLMFFLMVRMGLCGVRLREAREAKCCFYDIVSRVHPICMTLLLILTLVSWLRWCLSGFSIVKLLFFSLLSVLCSLEGRQPTLRERELCSTSWRAKAEFLHTLFGIRLHRRFIYPLAFISIESFICISVD